jgi:inosine-uridine nucleoside N-ribohydrolase
MGGAFEHPGNITAHAEANIFNDAAAADIVFAADMHIVMVGLNATMQTIVTPEDFAEMGAKSPKIGGFVRDISDFYLGFYRSVGVFDGCPMHDSTAVLACVLSLKVMKLAKPLPMKAVDQLILQCQLMRSGPST